MTFGLLVLDAAGNTAIDDLNPQLQLMYTGTLAATANIITTADVTYPATVAAPLVFMRAAVGVKFSCHSVTSGGFSYAATGPVEYRVYVGSPLTVAPTGFGLAIFNPSGGVIFDSNRAIPNFGWHGVCMAGDTTDLPVGAGQFTENQLIRSQSFSLAAHDGGLPFLFAHTLCLATYWLASERYCIRSVSAMFTSASAFDLNAHNKLITAPTGVVGSFIHWYVQRPSSIFLIR